MLRRDFLKRLAAAAVVAPSLTEFERHQPVQHVDAVDTDVLPQVSPGDLLRLSPGDFVTLDDGLDPAGAGRVWVRPCEEGEEVFGMVLECETTLPTVDGGAEVRVLVHQLSPWESRLFEGGVLPELRSQDAAIVEFSAYAE